MTPEILIKLRSLLLSPDSKLELWLRTQYHRINKTRLFFRIQDWLSKRSYQRWLKQQPTQIANASSGFEGQPKVTFLVSNSKNDKQDLVKTLTSIHKLQGDEWEVVLATSEIEILENIAAELYDDDRLVIPSSTASNLLDSIHGDYLVFCQAGDQFFPNFLLAFYQMLAEDSSADWYYYDCEAPKTRSDDILPLFKPSTLSPALLLSVNILSRGLIRREFINENLSTIKPDDDIESLEYHLSLMLCEKDGIVQHIPFVLIRQTSLVMPDTAKKVDVMCMHLRRSGLENVSPLQKAHGVRFTWQTSNPSVAIIIPTKNNRKLLEPWINSLIHKTSYTNFKIHLIDNNSDEADTLNYYHQIESNPKVQIHPYPKEFNYSEANNLGAAQSDSDLILFLNDDMEIIDPEWLTELVQWAERPEIGVVSTKLIRSNRTIQHAGIIMGLNGFAGHIYLNAPEHYHGLFGSVDWYRDYLAVTGACQMMRRATFDAVGGFDEGFKLAFGDIDICLRIHEKGYRIVYTPFASLFHFEGQSRGYATPKEDIIRGFNKMKSALYTEDPYFSPNLTYTRIPKFIRDPRLPGEQENFMEIRKKFYTKND